MSYDEMDAFINKKSGIQGLTGISSDMRDIDAAYEAGVKIAIEGRDLYYNRVRSYVGAYAAEMGGLDLVVFTGGVGENSDDLRGMFARIWSSLAWSLITRLTRVCAARARCCRSLIRA